MSMIRVDFHPMHNGSAAGFNQHIFNQMPVDNVDNGTLIEHKRNITEQEAQMTDFLRDMAAFTSIVMFVTSFAVVMMSI